MTEELRDQPSISRQTWYSQLFENDYDGGVLLALPHEALADWDGTGDEYDELLDYVDQFLCHPIGSSTGVFVGEDDGIHEAHWMRFSDLPGVYLVVWSAWHDPNRPGVPEDMKKVGRAWMRHEDPRQAWLEQRLRQEDLGWQRQAPILSLASGILLLMHAEGKPVKARFANPRAVAKCGQVVPVGLAPGDYRIETLYINEQPEGTNLCLVCRWVPVG